jgi:hypothetical protein
MQRVGLRYGGLLVGISGGSWIYAGYLLNSDTLLPLKTEDGRPLGENALPKTVRYALTAAVAVGLVFMTGLTGTWVRSYPIEISVRLSRYVERRDRIQILMSRR